MVVTGVDPDKIILIYGPYHITFQEYYSSTSNLFEILADSYFTLNWLMFPKIYGLLLGEEKRPAIKLVIKQEEKSVENIYVLPTQLFYIRDKFVSLVATFFKKIMCLKLIHLNMY